MRHQSGPFAIVLCTYNGEKYLEAQLSTLRQQEGVAEIIASDDGSKDGTMAILARHAAADPRIRIVQNPRALGVAGNFAAAIGSVRMPWIALSDQDDLWLPDKLARMRAAWDGEACLLHHATHKFHGRPPESLPSPARERRKFAGRDLRRLLYRNSVVGHTTLVRADVARRLLPFPVGVPHDWWLGVGAAALGGVQYLDEFLVHYRIHEHNSYHRAGSRCQRLRAEHGLRIHTLRAVCARLGATEGNRRFAAEYLGLLEAVMPPTFPWRLWWFYRRHAGLFFCAEGRRLSGVTAWRKSFMAAVGAAMQTPVALDHDLIPHVSPKTAAPASERWRITA